MKRSIATIILIGLAASSAQAGQGRVTVENETTEIISSVYISPSDVDAWGADRLGSDILSDGDQQRFRVHLDRRSGCFADIKMVFANGAEHYEWRVNACASPVITLSDRFDCDTEFDSFVSYRTRQGDDWGH